MLVSGMESVSGSEFRGAGRRGSCDTGNVGFCYFFPLLLFGGSSGSPKPTNYHEVMIPLFHGISAKTTGSWDPFVFYRCRATPTTRRVIPDKIRFGWAV